MCGVRETICIDDIFDLEKFNHRGQSPRFGSELERPGVFCCISEALMSFTQRKAYCSNCASIPVQSTGF